MKEITGNKDFVYEIACDQMCGAGHYSMKGLIIVETQEDYDKWLAEQKPQYLSVMASGQQAAPPAAPAVADSAKTTATTAAAKPIAQQLTK
jgi:cytochrome c oxidase subunit 2